MKANFRELGQETWFMIQQIIKTLLCESSTYWRFWIGFHEQPSHVSPHIRPSCAIPSSSSSRPLLSYVSPLLVPFSPSSFLRSPGWLLAHVSSLLVRSPPSSLAILLSTITTHRASSSCGFSTYIHFLIGLDDGTWTNVSDYADFVQIMNYRLMFCFCWAIRCFSQPLLLPLTSMVTEIDDDNCDLVVPLVTRQLDNCDNW